MQPTLQTARLILRPFHLSDAPVVQHLAGAPEVAATTLNVPHPYQDGMAEAWIKSHEKDFAARRQAVFAVAWRESNEFCGCIGLGIDERHRHAELGYWIGVPFWGYGICTEAAREILRFAFEELDLHRVYASHMTNNPASGRVMQKIGMMHEGCLREHYFKDGRFVTTEQYGILKSDWLNR
jgi:[ribosomal protein S5]-alanine N-acetyltransferase